MGRILDEPLSHMPLAVIKAFRLGCWLTSLTVAGFLAVMIGGFLRLWDPVTWSRMIFASAALWPVAAWMVTPSFDLPHAVVRGFGRGSRLRHAARWLQLGWPAAAGAGIWLVTAPPLPLASAALLKLTAAGGIVTGLAGVVVLAILLGRLAEWVRDDRAQRALDLAVWGVAPASALLLLDVPVPVVVAHRADLARLGVLLSLRPAVAEPLGGPDRHALARASRTARAAAPAGRGVRRSGGGTADPDGRPQEPS